MFCENVTDVVGWIGGNRIRKWTGMEHPLRCELIVLWPTNQMCLPGAALTSDDPLHFVDFPLCLKISCQQDPHSGWKSTHFSHPITLETHPLRLSRTQLHIWNLTILHLPELISNGGFVLCKQGTLWSQHKSIGTKQPRDALVVYMLNSHTLQTGTWCQNWWQKTFVFRSLLYDNKGSKYCSAYAGRDKSYMHAMLPYQVLRSWGFVAVRINKYLFSFIDHFETRNGDAFVFGLFWDGVGFRKFKIKLLII